MIKGEEKERKKEKKNMGGDNAFVL